MIESVSNLAEPQDHCPAAAPVQGNVLSFALARSRCTRRASSRHEVFGYVFEALLEQRLMPGDGLSLRWINDHYGVGRRVAEQVLNQLARAGLTQRRAGCTAQVQALDRQQLNHVLHARQVLEQSVTALLCRADSTIDSASLNALIAREKHFIEARQQAKALHCATRFHLMLVAQTQNEWLMQFAESLIARSYLGWVQHSTDSLSEHCQHREHLMSALTERNAAGARQFVQLSTTLSVGTDARCQKTSSD